MTNLDEVPHLNFLPRAYSLVLKLTKRHGLGTLSRLHHKMYPNGQTIRLRSGATMYLPADPHFFGYLTQVHEPHVADAISHFVSAGSNCIDVGANIGFFTLMLADNAGENGRVVAIEPIPENFKVLERNAKLSSGSSSSITVMNVAVSEKAGNLALIRRSQSTLHEVAPLEDAASDADVIGACSLDSIVAGLENGVADFVKVDVEGHESAVIHGAMESLRGRKVKRMLIEITAGDQASELDELLRPFARKVQIWLNGSWHDSAIADIPYRTDVMIDFASQESTKTA